MIDKLKADVLNLPHGSDELLDAMEALMVLVPIGEIDVLLDKRDAKDWKHTGDYSSAYEYKYTSEEGWSRAGRNPADAGRQFSGSYDESY